MNALKLPSRYCEFETAEAQLLRDRIVAGISDNNLRRQMVATADLTLDTCVEKARMSEALQHQCEAMSKTVTETAVVDVIQTRQQQNRSMKKSHHSNSWNKNNNNSSSGNDKQSTNNSSNSSARTNTNDESETSNGNNNNNSNRHRHTIECTYCGGVHTPRYCPAYGKTCHRCKRRNHFKSMCIARTVACDSADENNQSDGSEIGI